MGLTNYALEKMGFEPIPPDVKIEAYFQSINIYEVRGIVSDKEAPIKPEELVNIVGEVSFTIGDSVNTICELLVGDNFVDDEEKWRGENKCTPPYLGVLTKLTEPDVCEQGYWKNEAEQVVTHDCFTSAKESLQELENKKTAVIVAALSASLSTALHPVVFIPIAREVFAETNLQKRLIDFRFSFSGEGYVSNKIETQTVSEKIHSALQIYCELHQKVGYFFGLAVKEKDPLKKFLYYFLVIEIHTHNTFKSLDYSGELNSLHNLPARIANSVASFLIDRQKEAKNLSQRFIWCSLLNA